MFAGPHVTYALVTRPLADGQTAIVLHLYRGKRRALSTTLTTCTGDVLAGALRKCRAHLEGLDIPEGAPRLPMVSGLLCQALGMPRMAAGSLA